MRALRRTARRLTASRRLSSKPAAAPVVFLIAGEPSGDIIGGQLMRAMRDQVRSPRSLHRALGSGSCADPSLSARRPQYRRPIRFEGIGGDAMRAEGLSPLFPMADLTVAGFAEVAATAWILASPRRMPQPGSPALAIATLAVTIALALMTALTLLYYSGVRNVV